MVFSIERFTSPSGIRLRYGFTQPAHVRAYVMILQGLGEFIEHYDETAWDLAQRDLGCVAFDFRGQGGSERVAMRRNICHIDDVDEYCADTRHVLDHVRQKWGIKTDLLMSSSTGGLVGMKMLLADPDTWRSAVMIAPFFGLGGPDWLAVVARFLSSGLCLMGFARHYLPGQSHFAKLLRMKRPMSVATLASSQPHSAGWSSPQWESAYPWPPFDSRNPLTSDGERYARTLACLANNPDLSFEGISVGWLAACCRAQTEITKKISVDTALPPITMVLPGKDRIVDNRKTRAIFADNPTVTMAHIPESLHDILHEQNHFRAQLWRTFDQHLSRHHG